MSSLTLSDPSIHMERIIEKTKEGKVALFIGAGVSQVAGAPGTTELVEMIKSKFDKAQFESNDFINVCQTVIDSDYYDGRRELEDLIRRNLLDIRPAKSHDELTKHNWAAIFTTNFDDLIEESYRASTHKPRIDYYPVLTDNFTITDRSTLHIFKLMGTVHARPNDPGRMVLSRIDFINSLNMRAKCVEILSDLIRDGTIVFIGYSGKDQLAFEVIDAVAQEYGHDNLMRSYMLLNDLSWIEGQSLRFSRRNIIPIKCSFQEFMEILSKEKYERRYVPEHYAIRILGFDLALPLREIKPVLDYFHIMSESVLDEPAGNKDDFFRGINKSWGAFRENWDFQRDVYISQNGFRERISDELTKRGPGENKVLLMTGIPGIGKSMMLRRIAYDFYKKGSPVLLFDSTKSKFDFKVLDSLLMEIDRKLLDLSDGKETNAKSIILFDDLSSSLVNPFDVSTYLASRGRSSLIVASGRDGRLIKELKMHEKNVFRIPQYLTKNEIHKLSHHLKEIGYLTSTEIWTSVILRELERSFFAAMYTLVDPARRPLDQIISDQFNELTETQKRIFLVVCAFHRFNLAVPLEILVRVACNSNYEIFMKSEEDKRLGRIVTKGEDRNENIFYATHNRIIAQKTFDFFLGDKTRQKELYQSILENSHFSMQREREIIEKLLVLNFGTKSNTSRLTLDDRLELFARICQKKPTKTLLHHYGLLLAQSEDFGVAEKTLLKAKNFRERYIESYYGESNRNILTSLGCMYVEWAEHNLAAGKESDHLFEKAEKYLQDAMKFRHPTPHPYHALARMHMRRGDRSGDDPKRFEYYALALDVLDIGKRSVSTPSARELYGLETIIQAQVENEEAIRKAISIIEKTYRSPRGHYLLCKAIITRSAKMRAKERKRALEEALEVVREALYKFPTDEPCLRVKAEIIKKLYPGDQKQYFEALERWFQMSRWQTIELLYELAVAAFKLKYYDTSFKRFSRLEKRSRGHPERFVIREYMEDQKGQKAVYRGTIMRIENPYEGEIRVDSLQRLSRNIRFSVETCNFVPRENDRVTFFIGFNYASPQAIDVRRD